MKLYIFGVELFKIVNTMRDIVRRFGLIILPALLCAVACGTITEELPTYESSSLVMTGDSAPNFTATTIDGETVSLYDSLENGALLVLFSHECPDCKMLLDDIREVQQEFDELGLFLLFVARDGTSEEVAAYMSENSYDFDVVPDPSREIYNLYATTYVPRTYLLDKEGVVRYTTIEYDATYIERILDRVSK